jgi:Asp-tRNA(Asn)/Glu-tRNA(Gln) amidotransferase C subunit
MSCDEVAALARMASVGVTEEDLVDITYRINAILSSLEAFSDPGLDEVDPAPYLPFDEVKHG